MDFLVFRSAKSGNRVIVPADQSMVIDRANGTAVVYAIGGNGQDRMVWELPGIDGIKVVTSMREALGLHLPAADAPTGAGGGGAEQEAGDGPT